MQAYIQLPLHSSCRGCLLISMVGSDFRQGCILLSKIFQGLLQKKLAEAKADAVPQIESQLAKTMMELRSHVHGYIDKQSVLIQKNTQCAYESILLDIQKRIEVQIATKKQEGANVQKEMDELEAQAGEIREYMTKLSEEA